MVRNQHSYLSLNNPNTRISVVFGLLLLLLLAFFLFDLAWGNLKISWREIAEIIRGHSDNLVAKEVLINYRLPKSITAILVGSALSSAGLMMQSLFRNPLADPYVLGVSSGASLGVALVMLSSGVYIGSVSSWIIIVAAVLGAVLVMSCVIGVSLKVQNAVSLLIVGIMFGTVVSSIVGVLQYFSNPDAIKLFVMWNLGSLSSVSWQQIHFLAPVVILGLLGTMLMSKRLDVLLLGENYARALGIPILRTRTCIVLLTSILAGSVTAFTGPIGFIGLAVPHIARGLFKTSSHRVLIPASVLTGAVLLLVCDIVSQIPAYTLPINSISSLFGAPIIIWIILKKR